MVAKKKKTEASGSCEAEDRGAYDEGARAADPLVPLEREDDHPAEAHDSCSEDGLDEHEDGLEYVVVAAARSASERSGAIREDRRQEEDIHRGDGFVAAAAAGEHDTLDEEEEALLLATGVEGPWRRSL